MIQALKTFLGGLPGGLILMMLIGSPLFRHWQRSHFTVVLVQWVSSASSAIVYFPAHAIRSLFALIGLWQIWVPDVKAWWQSTHLLLLTRGSSRRSHCLTVSCETPNSPAIARKPIPLRRKMSSISANETLDFGIANYVWISIKRGFVGRFIRAVHKLGFHYIGVDPAHRCDKRVLQSRHVRLNVGIVTGKNSHSVNGHGLSLRQLVRLSFGSFPVISTVAAMEAA